MEISQEQYDKLQILASQYTDIFKKIIHSLNQFVKWVRAKWELVKDKWIEYYQLSERKEKIYKSQYRMNFSRPKIKNQVIDRRPRQMIRKIIK